MLAVEYNRAARKELFDSALYYSEQKPGLGECFLKEVEICIKEIARFTQTPSKVF